MSVFKQAGGSRMSVRRAVIGWLAALGALAGVATGYVSPAQGYVPGPPYLACFNSSEADLLALERSLSPPGSPAAGGSVQVGAPVTFSGDSEAPVVFSVASSPALLSSPDVDGGPGVLQPGTSSYAFTSTRATATPGVLIYWDASFSNAVLTPCEGMTPTTYATSVRTLAVVASSPTAAEVAAEKKQAEEATAAKAKELEAEAVAPATGSVSLTGSTFAVQSNAEALVELTCSGTATCTGKLTLLVTRATGRGKHRHARVVTAGTATFSTPAGKTGTVDLQLNANGRALLRASQGRLPADLEVLKSSPAPSQTQTKNVQLVHCRTLGETSTSCSTEKHADRRT